MLLEPLHEEEVLPKRTGVRTGRKRREVVQDSIADANVTKVDFLAFFSSLPKLRANEGTRRMMKHFSRISKYRSIVGLLNFVSRARLSYETS